jgi:DNA-binding response OmpR family regulator
VDGLRVMQEARSLAPDTVVIMLTAHATLDSAIEALRHGGHDYLLKPCTTDEILVSLEKGLAKRRQRLHQQALLRQMGDIARELADRDLEVGEVAPASQQYPRFLRAGDLLLDREKPIATLRGHPLNLTPCECKLLLCLMKKADSTVSFRELAQAIHGDEHEEMLARDAISTHLWRLRRKLSAVAEGRDYIINVRGSGYRLLSH